MDLIPSNVRRMLALLNRHGSVNEYENRLNADADRMKVRRLRPRKTSTAETINSLWDRIEADTGIDGFARAEIADQQSQDRAATYTANIENYIGTVKIPVGIVGPIRINGLNANGDYFAPLATTEAALVASYERGAELANAAGGVSAALLSEGVMRGPAFIFKNILEAGQFVSWVADNAETLKQIAETTTRYGKLIGLDPFIDSDTVFLLCRYETGDASGQNMVTVATQTMCEYIVDHCPTTPIHWFIEANFSGDKKASFLGVYNGRGRKVTASIEIPDKLIKRYLHTSSNTLLRYCRTASLGAMLSGQFGVQAHYANALAAFYIATGQDAACVSESSVGFTRMEPRNGGVFFSVTMPNILVGTVGGGTNLPSQSAALSIVGLKGEGQAKALAELVASLCLCGELSILGAIAAGHFTRAHERLARKR